jgi:hypothetical protein
MRKIKTNEELQAEIKKLKKSIKRRAAKEKHMFHLSAN